ncbi:MAG TPA: ribokinase [Armatimonadota bacterium]|nr:ribokinase [Armatimonadota bacterium]
MPRVLVVGSINMDLIVRCSRVPKAGETIRGDDFVTAGGGKGANQAIAASRLGARTAFVGRVGEDEFGPKLRSDLDRDGVDTEALTTDPEAPSGVALILLEHGGHNRIVIMSGANGRLGEPDVRAARALLANTDIVLFQLEIPLSVVAEIAAAARASSVPSILDAGPATPAVVEAGLPALIDIISPNESEAEILTGIAVRDLSDAARAASRLHDMGSHDVVLKLGAQGAYWSGPGGELHLPGFPIEPVDTTAAGDAFTACLGVSIASGADMPEAIRSANAAGACACLTLGAQPSMPRRDELDAFLRNNAG